MPLNIYILLFFVFILSFLGALILPINDLFKGVFATPAVVALIGALFQLARDHSAHESKLDLQRKQQIFNLGATSHMANVTFDKHVEFCENYMMEVDATVETLYRDGTTKKALKHSYNLKMIRNKYTAWLTEDIIKQLDPFERALKKIGADQGFIESTTDMPHQTLSRIKKIESVHLLLSIVLNFNNEESLDITSKTDKEEVEFISKEAVKNRIRQILDLENLVSLRKGLIKEACSYI